MKLCQWFLRLISPQAESERMEFRRDVQRAEAHAEEFHRTVIVHATELRKRRPAGEG